MEKLSEIIRFAKLIQDFSGIERVILKRNSKKWENDSEHSYQLAMVAWYIIEANRLKLKKDLVLKYALIHDLVEVYAGDTYFYSTKKNHESNKLKKEKKAAQRIKREFPKFKALHFLMRKYEQRKDHESKFVYALDKIIPIINIHLDNGRTWKKKNVSLQMLIDEKSKKVSVSSEIEEYFKKLINLLRKNKKYLFNKKD